MNLNEITHILQSSAIEQQVLKRWAQKQRKAWGSTAGNAESTTEGNVGAAANAYDMVGGARLRHGGEEFVPRSEGRVLTRHFRLQRGEALLLLGDYRLLLSDEGFLLGDGTAQRVDLTRDGVDSVRKGRHGPRTLERSLVGRCCR